jgi:hypothetical protein
MLRQLPGGGAHTEDAGARDRGRCRGGGCQGRRSGRSRRSCDGSPDGRARRDAEHRRRVIPRPPRAPRARPGTSGRGRRRGNSRTPSLITVRGAAPGRRRAGGRDTSGNRLGRAGGKRDQRMPKLWAELLFLRGGLCDGPREVPVRGGRRCRAVRPRVRHGPTAPESAHGARAAASRPYPAHLPGPRPLMTSRDAAEASPAPDPPPPRRGPRPTGPSPAYRRCLLRTRPGRRQLPAEISSRGDFVRLRQLGPAFPLSAHRSGVPSVRRSRHSPRSRERIPAPTHGVTRCPATTLVHTQTSSRGRPSVRATSTSAFLTHPPDGASVSRAVNSVAVVPGWDTYRIMRGAPTADDARAEAVAVPAEPSRPALGTPRGHREAHAAPGRAVIRPPAPGRPHPLLAPIVAAHRPWSERDHFRPLLSEFDRGCAPGLPVAPPSGWSLRTGAAATAATRRGTSWPRR